MKVVICGAGLVGTNIAKYLVSAGEDVTIIDSDPEVIERLDGTVEARGVVGHASHPNVLKEAGADGAHMLIGVTASDEVNMVACQMAHTLFEVPTKIARLRSKPYIDPAWSDLYRRNHLPIDVIISPEIEVAKTIDHYLQVPGAFKVIPLVNGRVRLVGVRVPAKCPVVGASKRDLHDRFPDVHANILAIIRGSNHIIPSDTDVLMADDEVYFVADIQHVSQAMAVFGHQETETQHLMIVGGGDIGQALVERVERDYPHITARVLEQDYDRARALAGQVNETIVMEGNAIEPGFLEEAGIKDVDTFVSVTGSDETNVMAALLAKKNGCGRCISLLNTAVYDPLISSLGIDAVVNKRGITVSSILQHVRRGRIQSVNTLGDMFAEVIEIDAVDDSEIAGTVLEKLNLPEGVQIGAVVRPLADDGKELHQVIMPTRDLVIKAGDRVVVFATRAMVKKVEKLFAVRLGFFPFNRTSFGEGDEGEEA